MQMKQEDKTQSSTILHFILVTNCYKFSTKTVISPKLGLPNAFQYTLCDWLIFDPLKKYVFCDWSIFDPVWRGKLSRFSRLGRFGPITRCVEQPIRVYLKDLHCM